MRRGFRCITWAAGMACLLGGAKPAEAEEVHPGLLLDVAVGAGLSYGGYPGGPDIAGPAVAAAITPARAWSVFALGLTLDVTEVQSLQRDFGIRGALLVSASAVALLTPERPGIDASLSLGATTAALTGFVQFDGSQLDSQSLFGPRLEGRLGYRFSNGLGVATTASYAHLANDVTSYEPVVMVARLTFVARSRSE